MVTWWCQMWKTTYCVFIRLLENMKRCPCAGLILNQNAEWWITMEPTLLYQGECEGCKHASWIPGGLMAQQDVGRGVNLTLRYGDKLYLRFGIFPPELFATSLLHYQWYDCITFQGHITAVWRHIAAWFLDDVTCGNLTVESRKKAVDKDL